MEGHSLQRKLQIPEKCCSESIRSVHENSETKCSFYFVFVVPMALVLVVDSLRVNGRLILFWPGLGLSLLVNVRSISWSVLGLSTSGQC